MAKKRSTPPAPAAQAYDMTLDFEGLMRILANSLYSEKKVFIRELVQNGHDSVRRRASRERSHHGRIDIDTRPDEGQINITDNGLGMSAADLREYLSRIGGSGTREVGRDQELVEGLVGQFGIGFLSGFIVAEHIEVRTRKLGDEQGWLWKNSGGKAYTIEPCVVEQPGTTVSVFIKDPADRILLQVDSVQTVIREYADMLEVPIHVNHSTTPINTMQMPWEREGVSAEERELDCQYYVLKTIRGDSVMETIPVVLRGAEGQPRAGGILYITKQRTFGVRVPRNLRIHQQRMFVTNDAQLLPAWAEFVSGILDTPMLTPNAARDGFIRNAAWRELQDALGEVIISHLAQLQTRDRKKLSFILKWHDLGIKAACHYHDKFFAKFAHLLQWRVNRGSGPPREDDVEDEIEFRDRGLAFHWRTLPEVLASVHTVPGRPTRLLCFTTASSANQYFEMANARGLLIVDASLLFEDKLIAAYAKLEGTLPVEVVHVDRGGSSGLLESLQEDDEPVRRLAEVMSQIIRPGGADLKVDAKRMAPTTLTAILWNPEASKGQMTAREVLDDPNASSSMRAMAEELLRKARHGGMRMSINAACPFIIELARQDLRDPEIVHVIRGVYNSTLLANAELFTPYNAKIFHEQFSALLEQTVAHIGERQQLRAQRAELEAERRALVHPDDPHARHRIIFVMTPFKGYAPLEAALRDVFEDRWGCQLFLARDRFLDQGLEGNVDAHMAQADAFVAEVSQGNPNVMYELGRARALVRPTFLLAHPLADTRKVELPADLEGRLRVEYALGLDHGPLAAHLEGELRKDQRLAGLLDDPGREHFVSRRRVAACLGKGIHLPDECLDRLVERWPTRERWRDAKANEIAKVLSDQHQEVDLADVVLKRVWKGLES